MTEDDIRSLLYVTEGTTLDFKRDQYPFAKASDDQKSEILKDLLGFANAWRKETAFILVGVQEGKSGPAVVHGISASDQLDDHSLQQFVNGKTNKPLRFHYRACQFEGNQIGVFEIEGDHPRPVFLKDDYGKLRRNAVYVRRGSGTDPQSPATPDEIAQMGKGEPAPSAEIAVTFCEPDREYALGTTATFEAELCKVPPKEQIPLLPRPDTPDGTIRYFTETTINTRVLRDIADFEIAIRAFRPIRFFVENVGRSNAENVRVEINVPLDLGMSAALESELPSTPRREVFTLQPRINKIEPPVTRQGSVTIDRSDEHCRMEFDCGTIQPGRRVRTDVVYVACRETLNADLAGLVYAASLSKPATFSLHFSFLVQETVLSISQLKDLGRRLKK